MKRVLLVLLLLFNFSYSQDLSIKEALKIAKEKEKDLLVFIHSEHCYFCRDMQKNTLDDKEVKEFIDKRFIFLKIDQDDKELLRDDLNTDFVPITYIISYEDEEILLELPGRKDKATFISIVKDTLLE